MVTMKYKPMYARMGVGRIFFRKGPIVDFLRKAKKCMQ